jgi:hypothetical protein
MTALLAGYRVTYFLALKKLELLAPRAFFVKTSYGLHWRFSQEC